MPPRYQAELPHRELEVLANKDNRLSAWYLFAIKVPTERKKEIFNNLRTAKIGVNVHYIPIYKQPINEVVCYQICQNLLCFIIH